MKIQNSSISMSSTHLEQSFQFMEHATIEGRASEDLEGVILSLSKEAEDGSYAKAIKSYEKQQKEAAEQKKAANLQKMLEFQKANKTAPVNLGTSDEYDFKIRMLRQMLEMLNKGKHLNDFQTMKLNTSRVLDLRASASQNLSVVQGGAGVAVHAGASVSLGAMSSAGVSLSISGANGGEGGSKGESATPRIGTSSAGTVWQKITVSSANVTEYESTSFMTQGKVQTEDGRSIDFNVAFSMSRACSATINSMEVSNYILTDPLVINLDTDMTEIADQKFFFDIDSDGKEEEISELGKGSGFLALDKNGDGKVNDGNELFGTKSGDGFKDLAEHDKDGNGWIDENDDVFSKLKVWIKDEDGNDVLLDLKEADIGAIYLGNANTEYSFKDESLNTNAVLRKTGVYLKESTGKVGTVSHVDLAV
ncbi:MAG: hypothetical protein J6I97_02650 [Agathobacter sp.]|nr:hypothetical protein [Agathobacter sp.]